jgi:MFS family permease
MSIGLFLGGIIGGWVYGHFGSLAIFELDAGLLLVWLIISLKMPELPPKIKAL